MTRASVAAALALLSLAGAALAQAPRPAPDADPPAVHVAPPTVFTEAARVGFLPSEKLVVLDRASGRALLVDPSGRAVLARLPTGVAPHEVAISPDGTRAYVANYGVRSADVRASVGPDPGDPAVRGGPRVPIAPGAPAGSAGGSSPPEGTVTVIDLETGSILRTMRPFRTAAGAVLPNRYRLLHGIQVGADGSRLWLTSEADSSVLELDARTGEVLMQWKTGAAMGRTLVTSRDSRKLFIANRWSDSITVIDRLTITAHRIPTGRQPEGLALSPTGQEVWVGNRGDHTLTVIDARRQRRLATLDAGGVDPVRLAFRPDGGEVWVANRGSRELAVFDARTRELVETLALDVEPLGLVFSPDGRRLYVTAPEAGRMIVVDTRWRHVLDSFETGGAPHGLAWSRVGPTAAAGRR